MKVKKLGEFGLIERIRRFLTDKQKGKIDFIGIGDDTAVIKILPEKYLLWTTDVLIEGIHFSRVPDPFFELVPRAGWSSGYILGWKSLAINLSDIAAMGGVPKYALVTLGLKGNEDIKFVDELYRGMKAVGQSETQILGGDISKSPVLMINISVLGEVEKKNLVLRKGARPGDVICVTGFCGDSAAGFELLKCRGDIYDAHSFCHCENSDVTSKDVAISLVKKHLMPPPRLKESQVIAKNHLATSMIDNSDGLLASIKFLCQTSGVGAKIYEDKIPISQELRNLENHPHLNPSPLRGRGGWGVNLALTGGEDYELIFTVPPHKLRDVLTKIPKLTTTPVSPVGEIVRDKKIYVFDARGKKRTLKNIGYDHFK